MGKWKIRTGLL